MREERDKQDFMLVKLPKTTTDEDRGLKECCVEELVLASNTNLSWKNDITPDWIKLYSISDTVTFKLLKNGSEAIYQPVVQSFPNDQYSKYIEVHWKDVLVSDGVGCYSIKVDYSISGAPGSYTKGEYKLLPFTVENAKGTARLRAKFNHFQETDGINFKGANVNGTIRFKGKIGDRQPNKEIDTLIYSNREVKTVVSENLFTYELKTDGIKERFTTLLTETYLLSNVQLFASDHNISNHSYKILDIPVILEETEELEYIEFSRLATVNAKLSDKFNNKRTYYS